MLRLRSAHPLFAALALVATIVVLPACGGKKKGGTTDPNTKINGDGTPDDGLRGSPEPHPAACTTCATNSLNTVAGCDAGQAGEVVPCEGFCFVDPAVTPLWNHNPPVTGPAYPSYDAGHYGSEVTPPLAPGYWVHNLAHGYVVIAYNCPGGCEGDVNAIKSVMANTSGSPRLITATSIDLGGKFAALAWGYKYVFDTVDTSKLACFIKLHVNHGQSHGGLTFAQ